ncbi:MerR family transcriptional regulator [Kitasatospora sp. NPDC049258]|uniref:DNA polymerase III subunit beta family protein n=1 Tax=Kitasatospora sp. NPDC049258 TaxID=3155394 RepID=UPI003413D12B
MESSMRSIGEMARDSGLSVSALRFYDGAGVFGPAEVDPRTGYRRYAPRQLDAARLLARLRRVGMPLADIRLVLAGDVGTARHAVDAHLRRLEDGLADARRELATVRTLIASRESTMDTTQSTRLTLAAPELAAALDAVRFAAAPGAELPAVAGVLFETDGGLLRLVATDRYRLALSQAPVAELDGPGASVIVPTALLDEVRVLLDGARSAELLVEGDRLTLAVDGRTVTGQRIDQDYPDYRALIRLDPTHRVELGADLLRAALATGPVRPARRGQDGAGYQVSVLTVDPAGSLSTSGEAVAGGLQVQVNRDFLLEAVAAGGSGQLVLEFGGPIAPLAIRFPERADTFSLLMPTVL